jgi:hypothetical protein
MSDAIKKHQTDSLALLHSSAGPGKMFEPKLALLRKMNVSLMMEASVCVRAAGGAAFFAQDAF